MSAAASSRYPCTTRKKRYSEGELAVELGGLALSGRTLGGTPGIVFRSFVSTSRFFMVPSRRLSRAPRPCPRGPAPVDQIGRASCRERVQVAGVALAVSK